MRKNNLADGTQNRPGRQSWDEADQYRQPSGDSMQRNYGQQRSQQDYSQRSQQQDDPYYNSDYRSNNYPNTGNEYNDSAWREPQRGQRRQQDNYNDWRQEDRYNDDDSNRMGSRRSGYRSNEQDHGRNQDFSHNDWNQQGPYDNQRNWGNNSYDWNGGRYDRQGNYDNRGSRGYDNERNRNYGQTNYGNQQGNMGGNYSGNYGSERYDNTGYAGQQRSGGYGNDWSSGRYGQQSQQQDQGLHRGKGPKGYQRTGERIREDISDRLSDDGMLDATDIEVQMEGNDVILSGTVSSREAKRRAEEIAEAVSGVSNVENRIKLQNSDTPGTSQTAGSATIKTNASDTGASNETGADKNNRGD